MNVLPRVAVALLVALELAACDEEPVVVGPAAPSSAIACVGVPAAKCDDVARQALKELRVDAYRSITVTCTKGTCTDRRGEVKVDVIDADGRPSSIGTAWETLDQVGVPAPPMPAPTPFR